MMMSLMINFGLVKSGTISVTKVTLFSHTHIQDHSSLGQTIYYVNDHFMNPGNQIVFYDRLDHYG